MKKETVQILIAAWLTGIVSIIYELVWVRYLGLVLGNSVYAVGVVTACYMAGLALGDFLIGAWTERSAKKSMVVTFAGLALFCFLSPVLYRLISTFNRTMPAAFMGSDTLKLVWRAGISFFVLLIPTALIGGTLPVLIGRSAGRGSAVYTANTLGAVMGAVLTGFFLIRHLGLPGSAAVGGGLMVVAFLLIRNGGAVKERRQAKSHATTAAYSAATRKTALLVYGISGFTGMAFQVYQTRILTLFFMDSVYDFAVILAVYLTGLFIGNALSTVWAEKTSQPVFVLSATQIMLGICTVLGLYLVGHLPYWTDGLASQNLLYERYGNSFFLMGIWMKAGYTCLLVLIPAVLWGMAYPMVSKICAVDGGQSGRTAGIVLGWNTTCSAGGSLLASFLLIGVLGIRRSIMINGCLNLAAGFMLLLSARELSPKKRMAVSAAGMVLVFAALVGVPQWNRFEMSTSFLKPGQDVEGYADIRYYKEDAYGITSVVDFLPYDETYLTTNRLYCQNTSNMTGPEDHRRLGYIPLILHPAPQKVLVEGLGAGVTLRGVNEYGSLDIDCVEISGAVVEAAREFAEENGNVLESDQVNLVIDDARNYLLTSDESYDVIIADIFFPMSSGSSSMFSREYYQACLDRLDEDGIMAQWIPLHQFSMQELAITLKTFSQVFPDTQLWFGMIGPSVPVVGIIGGKKPLEISFDRISSFYDGGRDHKMDLGNTALDDPYMFLSHFIKTVGENEFDDNIPCNTDERPVLEFLNPTDSDSYQDRGANNIRMLLESRESVSPSVDFGTTGQPEILGIYEGEIEEFIRNMMN